MAQWLFGRRTTQTSPHAGSPSSDVEDYESLLPQSSPGTPNTAVTQSAPEHAGFPRSRSSQRRLRRSASDQNPRKLRDGDQGVNLLSPPQTDSATLQQRLAFVTQTRSSNPAPLTWRRSIPVRSVSDYASSSPLPPVAKHRALDIPLKPCMKQASKSTTGTTPSDECSGSASEIIQPIRRVKTVDFNEPVPAKLQEASPGSLSLETKPSRHIFQASQAEKTTRKATPCLGPRPKSTLAETATTWTDVHVVAIAPSGCGGDFTRQGGEATPTMQMVESKAGCYEIIWDNVPPDEDDLPRNRRNSSASQSLYVRNNFRCSPLYDHWRGSFYPLPTKTWDRSTNLLSWCLGCGIICTEDSGTRQF
jgi:hypothetical protein